MVNIMLCCAAGMSTNLRIDPLLVIDIVSIINHLYYYYKTKKSANADFITYLLQLSP